MEMDHRSNEDGRLASNPIAGDALGWPSLIIRVQTTATTPESGLPSCVARALARRVDEHFLEVTLTTR
jgi:hypothetical protein